MYCSIESLNLFWSRKWQRISRHLVHLRSLCLSNLHVRIAMWQNSLHWVGVGIFVSWTSAKNLKKALEYKYWFYGNEIRMTFLYIYFILLTSQQKCWISVGLINSYVPNKVIKVLYHARNLCKAAGKIVAVSARWKTRGQGPGTGYRESGKRGVWKKWGVWKKKNSVCKQISSLSVALDEMPTATCQPSESAT